MTFKDKLVLKLPLIQAPLTAYPNQAKLVSAVSEQGALGVYCTNFQTLNAIKSDITVIKDTTKKPFAVLIDLMESETKIDLADRSATNAYLNDAYKKLKLETTEAPAFPDVNAVCKAVVEQQPSVLIFQNGTPTDAFIEHCQRSGIITMAIATNTLEAIAIDNTQIDAIILQGSESAGIQSQFENDLEAPHFPIASLIHHTKQQTNKPLIAWGDCQSPKAAAALLKCGIKAVILDVPFWTVSESPIPESYRKALAEHNEMLITTTEVWSGQSALVLQNRFTKAAMNNATLPCSKQRRLLKPIIDAAIKQDNADYLPLWAGLCATSSTGTLTELCDEYAITLAAYISNN